MVIGIAGMLAFIYSIESTRADRILDATFSFGSLVLIERLFIADHFQDIFDSTVLRLIAYTLP